MAVNPERHYTIEEYFEMERTSEERCEYWNGEVFCMSGTAMRIYLHCAASLSLKRSAESVR